MRTKMNPLDRTARNFGYSLKQERETNETTLSFGTKYYTRKGTNQCVMKNSILVKGVDYNEVV